MDQERETGAEAPPGRAARALESARAGFRRAVPPGWSWRRVVVAVVLIQAAAALVLLTFMAATDRSLVVELRERAPSPDEAPPTGPSERLVIPVAGILPGDLQDTWAAPRTADREHLGIDIHAPAGTPVLAAAHGVIVRMDRSGAGGITLHQRGLDGRTVYYYAHLQRYRSGLKVGDLVRQGETLAYVGDTGNARGIPHLHFAVYAVTDPNRVGDGRHFNPYLLLVEEAPGGAGAVQEEG